MRVAPSRYRPRHRFHYRLHGGRFHEYPFRPDSPRPAPVQPHRHGAPDRATARRAPCPANSLPPPLLPSASASRAHRFRHAHQPADGATPTCLGLYLPEQLEGWKSVTQARASRASGKIVARQARGASRTSLQPGGAAPVAPSAVTAQSKTYSDRRRHRPGRLLPHLGTACALDAEGTVRHRPGLRQRAAPANAPCSAKPDGVHIHGANGHLLDQSSLKDGANASAPPGWQRGKPCTPAGAGGARLRPTPIGSADRTGLRLSPVTPGPTTSSDSQPPAAVRARWRASARTAGAWRSSTSSKAPPAGRVRGRRPPVRLRSATSGPPAAM